MDIDQITRRYNYFKSRDVECYLTSHELLLTFFKQKRILDPELKNASQNDKYAEAVKALINYLAFELANCPLFLNCQFYYRENRIGKIEENARKMSLSFPSLTSDLNNLISTIKLLRECNSNPLLETIETKIGYDNATLILINPDYVQAVTDMCIAHGFKIKVCSPNNLRDTYSKKGIFCGCAKFFPGHSFYAPEFQELHLVRFGWFHDQIVGHSSILGQRFDYNRPELKIGYSEPVQHGVMQQSEETFVVSDPTYAFDISILQKFKSHESSGSSDSVPAKIVMLRGGKFVFLPADVDYRHHCLVNLDNSGLAVPTVKKIPISEFNEYTAILLREREIGDYVTDMADKLMGSRSQLFRTQQKHWKKLLATKIEEHGISQVCKELALKGCKTAGYQNIRNWISPRFIRLLGDDDFFCLLNYLGLEEEAPLIMRNMSLIRRSHTKAGHRISEQLRVLAQNDNNLKTLLTDGYRFYTPHSGGRLGVYVFERALDDEMNISHTETGGVKALEAIYG